MYQREHLMNTLLDQTSIIVAAYLAKNTVFEPDLPRLIQSVHDALKNADLPVDSAQPQTPAVPVRKSITEDYIICLEDGRRMKSLKRHLKARYNLTPQEYRQKWGLPFDYPMVAPNYSARRSLLAKRINLGRPHLEVVK